MRAHTLLIPARRQAVDKFQASQSYIHSDDAGSKIQTRTTLKLNQHNEARVVPEKREGAQEVGVKRETGRQAIKPQGLQLWKQHQKIWFKERLFR